MDITVIKDFSGILGAILGSTSTLIITHILKNVGKLDLFINKWEGKFKTYKEIGCHKQGKNDDDLYGYDFQLELEILNNSDVYKIMRKITICFEKDGILQFSIIPYDKSTRRFASATYIADEIKVINIKPKQITHVNLYGFIHEKDLDKIKNAKKIYLKYYNKKSKAIKKGIDNLI